MPSSGTLKYVTRISIGFVKPPVGTSPTAVTVRAPWETSSFAETTFLIDIGSTGFSSAAANRFVSAASNSANPPNTDVLPTRLVTIIGPPPTASRYVDQPSKYQRGRSLCSLGGLLSRF